MRYEKTGEKAETIFILAFGLFYCRGNKNGIKTNEKKKPMKFHRFFHAPRK